MPRSRINGNFIDKTFSIVANILLRIIPTTSGEKEAFTYYRDGEQAIRQGDSEIAEAWFDQAAEYWKQAIALTPGNYIEAHNWLKITRRFE
nr:photosystem I assembly protein Ycf3 [Helleborus atrorubens]